MDSSQPGFNELSLRNSVCDMYIWSKRAKSMSGFEKIFNFFSLFTAAA
jgi:hypothetical protein